MVSIMAPVGQRYDGARPTFVRQAIASLAPTIAPPGEWRSDGLLAQQLGEHARLTGVRTPANRACPAKPRGRPGAWTPRGV